MPNLSAQDILLRFVLETITLRTINSLLIDVGLAKELFDVDKHVKKVVHDAFEQCDTSQVFYY